MITKTPEVQKMLADVSSSVTKACAGYVGDAPQLLRIKHIIFSELKRLFPDVPPLEFHGWLEIITEKDRPDIIAVKLNHQRMMEEADYVPDWVYALYWAFNPKHAPTFNKEEINHD
jgi:hypothetical protein